MRAPDKLPSTDCYVAFLDILGFKDIVLAHSHEHLKSTYEGFCEAIRQGLSNEKHVLSDNGETESIAPDIRQATVNSLLVSDSILIWTDDNAAESFSNIVKAVRSLLAFSLNQTILLRGAIAIGPLTTLLTQWPSQTHNIQCSLFGKAVVAAVEAEKKQEWCGCEITETAIECYKKNCSNGESLIKSGLILRYPVPRKNEETNGWVIDWVNHHQVGIDTRTVENAFVLSLSKNPSPEEREKIKRKLTNTLNFVKHVKAQKNQAFTSWRRAY